MDSRSCLCPRLGVLVHTSAVEISKESFAEINYAMMGYYKLAVILFNVTPYLVLRFAKFSR